MSIVCDLERTNQLNLLPDKDLVDLCLPIEPYQVTKSHGNHKKATEEYINLLLKIVDEDPKELGYEFGRWTAARLAEHLEKETGIKLSGSQVRRILRRKKYVYIWAKYSLEDKQDKKLRKAFKEKLDEYLKLAKEKRRC